ncbi:MAG: glycosyl hydrolase family 28-related protein, partial [Armatimonadota bacterium]
GCVVRLPLVLSGAVVLCCFWTSVHAIADIGQADGFFSVREFGAKGDGDADDTKAFQDALDAAGEVGGWVMVPPVGPGKGYVLTETVVLPEGVALVGCPFGMGSNVRAVFDLRDSKVKGAAIFARPTASQYEGRQKSPLFQLSPGCTLKGLWIMYDQQPMPADEDFQDPGSPYYYESFDEAKSRFTQDHVKPYGPTVYCAYGPNIVIEDIICDRYYDFAYMDRVGKCHFNRITLHGYKRAFVFEVSRDVIHMDNIAYVPNVGPQAPGGPHRGRHYSWVYGIIASQPDNVGIHLGSADGYSLSDIFFFGIHTALRLGYSPDYPLFDPVAGESAPDLEPGRGPWGSIAGFMTDQCAVGIHFVWPCYLTNRIANTLIFPSFSDGRTFPAVAGTGPLADVGQQAAFLVSSSHSRQNCNGRMPTFMCSNTVIASFSDRDRFASASAAAHQANGRVFLLDGDILMELSNFQANAPYSDDRIWARGANAKDFHIRAHGFVVNSQPKPDLLIDGLAGPTPAPGQ